MKRKNRKNKKTKSKRGGKSLRLKQRGGGWEIAGIAAGVVAAMVALGLGTSWWTKSGPFNPRDKDITRTRSDERLIYDAQVKSGPHEGYHGIFDESNVEQVSADEAYERELSQAEDTRAFNERNFAGFS